MKGNDALSKQFLTTLSERNPQIFKQLVDILETHSEKNASPQTIFTQFIELLQEDLPSLILFNKNFPLDRRIKFLEPEKIREMMDFMLEEILKKKFSQEIFNNFANLSDRIFKEILDSKAFYSHEHLIDAYLEQIYLKEIEEESLGEEFCDALVEVLNAFKGHIEARLTREREERLKAEERRLAQLELEKKQKVRKNTSPVPASPIKKVKFSCLEDLKKDSEIFEFLRIHMEKNKYDSFLKLVFLYYNNIVSFVELVGLSENLLKGLEKDVFETLKHILESRELTRLEDNCFNIKQQILEFPLNTKGKFNGSYRELAENNLLYQTKDNELINKRYACVVHGVESTSDNSGTRRILKNVAEEELLKIEDEMHEFDHVIQQYTVFGAYLEKLKKPDLEEIKVKDYLRKLKNSKIIGTVYGNKHKDVIKLIEIRNTRVIDTIVLRFKQQVVKLKEAKKYCHEYWQPLLKDNYYRSLDVLSNVLKMEEKKMFVNKNLIDELKTAKCKRKNGKYRSYSSIQILLKNNKEELVNLKIKEKTRRFHNPAFVFGLKNQETLSHVVFLFRFGICNSKLSIIDKQRANVIVTKLLVNFLGIKEKEPLEILSLIKNGPEIKKSLHDLHINTTKDNKFKYFNEFNFEVNEQKLIDLFSTISQCHPGRSFTEETEKKPDYPNAMKVLEEVNTTNKRVFFGSYQFYLYFRYFLYIIERFTMVAESSQNGQDTYNLFLKLVYYNIHGIINNQNYEDGLKLLLGNKNGLLLNIDKMCTNAIKLTLNDDFSLFVFDTNQNLFNSTGSQNQREDMLFAKSCYRLNELIFKNTKTKNSAINSFNSNYNISSNDVLKFETEENCLVVHKLKSLFQESNRHFDNFRLLIEKFDPIMSQADGREDKGEKEKAFSINKIDLHFHNKKKECVFNHPRAQNISLKVYHNNEEEREKKRLHNMNEFRRKREELFSKKL